MLSTIRRRFGGGGPESSSIEESRAEMPLNSGVGEGSDDGYEDNGVELKLRGNQDCAVEDEKGLGVRDSVLKSELASFPLSSSNDAMVATCPKGRPSARGRVPVWEVFPRAEVGFHTKTDVTVQRLATQLRSDLRKA